MEARNDSWSKITPPAHVQIEDTALPAKEGLARASRVLREGQKCCKDPSTWAPGINMLPDYPQSHQAYLVTQAMAIH